jgi:uncharacterized protein YyaL (SSP411 family)
LTGGDAMNTKTPNRLIHEKSPYLLQHAYNPVDWYPWGKEAFEKAKREDKPVFLSIGYSTCHWCHVMAHESFEDEEVAEALNRDFVCIKVDKEERPDVDAVYMAVCQAMTGSGGWPLTILMTAEQKPFFAGTYFPKYSRYSLPGILDLLSAVAEQWRSNREQLLDVGEKILDAIRAKPESRRPPKPSEEIIGEAASTFLQTFDEKYGGFGHSPKFPTPHNLLFLLHHYYFDEDERLLAMVEKTLEQMYRGGIYDHIGYGFSRYSTDEKWLVPHFEKMLYDNALLAMAYVEAFLVTSKVFYRTVTERILEYVLREMTDSKGGFYCAQDADSEGQEGKYYVFTPDEIRSVLGAEDGAYFNRYFNITENGNFEGKSIPNRIGSPDFEHEDKRIQALIPKVYAYRLRRTQLNKDDKILTSWNGLMIAAFARAYRVLGGKRYLTAAQRATEYLLEYHTVGDRLCVRSRDGEASGSGGIDDYAFFVWALLELYEATFEARYLEQALRFCQIMTDEFRDEENGGFYLTAKSAETLIYRLKETYDGAIPSGNSVAGYCLQKLARLTGRTDLIELAAQQMDFLTAEVWDYPAGHSFALMALMSVLYPAREVVCVLKKEEDLTELQTLLRKKFLPNTEVLVIDPKNAEKIHELAEFTKDYALKNDEPTFYVCQNNACSAPFNGFDDLEKNLL